MDKLSSVCQPWGVWEFTLDHHSPSNGETFEDLQVDHMSSYLKELPGMFGQTFVVY